MHADVTGTYPQATNGTGQAWGGNRARTDLINKFFPNGDAPNVSCTEMPAAANDDRAIFDGKDRTLDNGDGYLSSFKAGFAVAKWNNFKTDNSVGKNDNYPDTDFFLFRVAEAYLNAAEAEMHLNGESSAKAKKYIDALRNRAHAAVRASYTLNDVLDERARELYCEGLRRTDLIRFNQFGGSQATYNWELKGGSTNGTTFAKTNNVYPLPSSEVLSNKNLTQIDGYNEVQN